jgi:hypothetical protein
MFSGLSSAPAKADGTCPKSKSCLWLDGNFSGCRYVFFGNQPDLRNQTFQDCPQQTVNDTASSYDNNNGFTYLALHTEPNYHGKFICVAVHQRGNIPLDMNDQISSINTYGDSPPAECK